MAGVLGKFRNERRRRHPRLRVDFENDELLLPASGLSVEGLYGSYDLDPFQTGSPRLIVAAVPIPGGAP